MAVQLPAALALEDAFCCLGLGLIVAACYDLARFFLGDGRTICFVLDVLAFVLAAVLLVSFSAGRSAGGTVRWYMTAAVGAGAWSYFFVLAPATFRLQQLLRWALALPLRIAGALTFHLLISPLRALCRAGVRAVRVRCKKIFFHRGKKRLKKAAKVLYNSN